MAISQVFTTIPVQSHHPDPLQRKNTAEEITPISLAFLNRKSQIPVSVWFYAGLINFVLFLRAKHTHHPPSA